MSPRRESIAQPLALRPISQVNSYPWTGPSSMGTLSGCDLEDADAPLSKRESVAELCRSSGKVSGQPDPGDVAIGAGSLPTKELDRVPVFGRRALPPSPDLCPPAPGPSLIRELRIGGETGHDCVGIERGGRAQVGGDAFREVEPYPKEVDSLSAHRHTFSEKPLALALSFGDAPVGANDALPRKILVSRRQHPPDQTRRLRIDLAVGTYRTLGNLTNPGDDAGYALLVAGRIRHRECILNPAVRLVRWTARSNTA